MEPPNLHLPEEDHLLDEGGREEPCQLLYFLRRVELLELGVGLVILLLDVVRPVVGGLHLTFSIVIAYVGALISQGVFGG